MTKPKTENWLGVEEISKHLGVSKETIYRRLEEESIPSHRIGKLWRFKVSEVDMWVKSGKAADDLKIFKQKLGPRNR
ncbi:MAG: helix-turn-helix domain-containing protein [Deltaproteobacteria bacterium]|nr:helix-turn-helix domain-containing protein [Deltaproteobacteria bacterium]